MAKPYSLDLRMRVIENLVEGNIPNLNSIDTLRPPPSTQ